MQPVFFAGYDGLGGDLKTGAARRKVKELLGAPPRDCRMSPNIRRPKALAPYLVANLQHVTRKFHDANPKSLASYPMIWLIAE
jgi:hypothetical protein